MKIPLHYPITCYLEGDVTASHLRQWSSTPPPSSEIVLLLTMTSSMMRSTLEIPCLNLIMFCCEYAFSSLFLPGWDQGSLCVLAYIRQVPSQNEKHQHLRLVDCNATSSVGKEEITATWEKQLTEAMISTLQVKIHHINRNVIICNLGRKRGINQVYVTLISVELPSGWRI